MEEKVEEVRVRKMKRQVRLCYCPARPGIEEIKRRASQRAYGEARLEATRDGVDALAVPMSLSNKGCEARIDGGRGCAIVDEA